MPRLNLLAIQLISVLVVVACSATPSSPSTSAPSPTSAVDGATIAPSATASPSPTMPDSTPPDDPTVSPAPSATTPAATTPAATAPATTPPPAVVLDQPWAVAQLTDVSSGETFTIADLVAAGKVVFVEPMAVWCSNCRVQQAAAVEAFATLDPGTAEWVAVDVETSESAETLASYKAQNGFPFRYVIADQALSRSLVGQFGDIVLSPPSVNIIVVGTDGQITHSLGHQRPADLITLATEHAQ